MPRIDSFMAAGNDGITYQVDVFRKRLNADSANGGPDILGLPEYRTADGRQVNHLKGGQYEIDHSGVVLNPDTARQPRGGIVPKQE